MRAQIMVTRSRTASRSWSRYEQLVKRPHMTPMHSRTASLAFVLTRQSQVSAKCREDGAMFRAYYNLDLEGRHDQSRCRAA